jgi:hypothetical protein
LLLMGGGFKGLAIVLDVVVVHAKCFALNMGKIRCFAKFLSIY